MTEAAQNTLQQSRLLQKVAQVFLGTRDFKRLAKESVDLMTRELKENGLLGAGIFRLEEKKGLAAYAYSAEGFDTVEKLLPAKFSELVVPMNAKDNLLVQSVLTKEMQESTKLSDFSNQTLSHPISAAIQKAVGFSHVMAYPILLRSGKAAGSLLVGFKEKPTEEQRILLETFRLQLELAFENVLEFEKVIERYKRNMAKAFEKTHEEDIPTIRFTLRLTPKQNALLEKKAEEEDTDKTSLLRSLIDGLEPRK